MSKHRNELSAIGYDVMRSTVEAAALEAMGQPVRCVHCGGIYDLTVVTVEARYTDCSVWKTPCCGRTVDDRGETGWKLRGDYERIER